MTDDRHPVLERRARPQPRSAAASCPSCGAPLPAPVPARARRDSGPTLLALTSAFLAGAALIVLVVIVRPPARPAVLSALTPTPPAVDAPRSGDTTATSTPAVSTPAPSTLAAATPGVPQPTAADGAPARPSASRGQRDWRFFFAIGDALTRMRDGAALGTVIRLEKWYGFPDGTQGPAYVLRAPQGEAIFDADELERGARIQ